MRTQSCTGTLRRGPVPPKCNYPPMNPQTEDAILATGSDRGNGFWRRALSGITPRVVVILALLLLARTFGSGRIVGDLAAGADEGRLGATWLFDTLVIYPPLVVLWAAMLITIVATGNLGPRHGPKRAAALTAAVVLSAGAGNLLRIAVANLTGSDLSWHDATRMLTYVWPRYALLSGMLTVAHEFYRREVASVEAARQAEIDRVGFEGEMAEARLQVLQAQVEPHFLFNTLANVRRLYDVDRAGGRTMLESLIRYLETALPRMRDQDSTLGRDAELVEAFLRVHQVRMGRRLSYAIDIPASLRAHSVPPMMLLTLVENAIKHGLNPSEQGGAVRVAARCDDGRLVLSVADTGTGFAPGSGGGTGLANIRARLAAQFGASAALFLENNDLGGATASIVLPLADAEGSR